MPTQLFPDHGKINCTFCKDLGYIHQLPKEWKWRNDPGAWGSSDPSILVLGFSKGATQADVYQTGSFDAVPFAGSRNYLTIILQRVGLLKPEESVDEKMRKGEKEFAFGSFVRCSLTRLDPKTRKQSSSGPLIIKSFSEIQDILISCAARFQKPLPQRTRLIIMLGTQDRYIKGCREIMAKLYPQNFKNINEVAYSNGKHTWVHLTHPSPGNGWKTAWLNDPTTTTTGRKREFAISVIENLGMQRTVYRKNSPVRQKTKIAQQPVPKSNQSMPKPVQPIIREEKTNQGNKELLCHKFYFLHEKWGKLYAVAMKNRDTGRYAYRVSDKGNRKTDGLEVDEEVMIRKVFHEGYAVRMKTVDGKHSGLYRPPGGRGKSSIIKVEKLTES